MSLDRRFGLVAISAIAFVGAMYIAAPKIKGAQAQQISSTPATIMAGVGTPAANSIPCNVGAASTVSSSLYNQRETPSGQNAIWKCALATDNVTYAWLAPFVSTAFQSQDFSLQPGLFATGAVKSNVYYEPSALTMMAVTSREEGSPICTAAPVVVILDLGTSPSTAYGSATILYSQTLSTSNTVVSGSGLSVPIAAGHFIGIGLSAGTCVTPPTISTVVTAQ